MRAIRIVVAVVLFLSVAPSFAGTCKISAEGFGFLSQNPDRPRDAKPEIVVNSSQSRPSKKATDCGERFDKMLEPKSLQKIINGLCKGIPASDLTVIFTAVFEEQEVVRQTEGRTLTCPGLSGAAILH